MSFYLRKSVRLGPMRVNMSTSGLGVSVGIPGIRVGVGPRGSYVRVGGGGAHYRATQRGQRSPVPGNGGWNFAGQVVLSDVTGARAEALLPVAPSELVSQLNSAARSIPSWPIGAVVTVLLLFTVPWLVPVVVLLTIWLAWLDKIRRTVVAFYEVDGPVQAGYQTLVNCFRVACQTHAAWHVVASGDLHTTYQRKVNAGAGALVQRQRLGLGVEGPRHLKSNIEIPALRSSHRSVYFLPDRILLRDGKTYADISYGDVSVFWSDESFIETGMVPADGQQIGTTWKYVNKSGGPDRRFKENRQLPVMRYGRVCLRARGGLNILWSFSNVPAAETLGHGITTMRGTSGR